VVQCRFCRAVTEVDNDAATYLESLRETPDSAAGASFISSGNGSSTTQELDSQVVLAGQTLPRLARHSPDQVQPIILDVQPRLQPFPAAANPGTGATTSSVRIPVFVQARTPSPISLMRAPRPVRFCGQCEERPADLLCEQCDELFCRSCAAAIHRRGQMAKHNLRLHLGNSMAAEPSNNGNAIAAEPFNNVSGRLEVDLGISPGRGADISPRAGEQAVMPMAAVGPVPFVRKFLRCPAHPDEPLQFFCLTCECECICAECALHGEHRNHDVLNLREATKQLPNRAAELLGTARVRAEEIGGVVEGLKGERHNLTSVVAQSRRELGSQFDAVKAGLAAEEQALMVEVQRCCSEVGEILQPADQAAEVLMREAQSQLRRHHGSGDAIHSLNAFVKLSDALAVPPLCKDAGIGIEELKAQLQRGFESRLSSIASLAAQIDKLKSTSPDPFFKEAKILSPSQKMSPGAWPGWASEEAERENRKPITPYFQMGSLQDSFGDKALQHSRTAVMQPLPAPPGKRSPAARFGNIYSPEERQGRASPLTPDYR